MRIARSSFVLVLVSIAIASPLSCADSSVSHETDSPNPPATSRDAGKDADVVLGFDATVPDASSDASDASDARDASDASDASDARDASDAGASDAGDASAGDSGDASDAAEAGPARGIAIGYTASGATKGGASGNGALNIGREFHVTEAGITIVDLGIWDEGANGLNDAHTVTLFRLDKTGPGGVPTPVPGGSVTVPAGTAAALQNGFRFAPLLAPIDVTTGDYAIVAYGMSAQDPYGDNGNIPLSTTGIVDAQFDPYQFVTAASPSFPTAGDGNNHSSASLRYKTTHPQFARILPFGDSITLGTGGTNAGYRAALGALLDGRGFAHQFVGVAADNPGNLSRDQSHHEGHSGFVIRGGNGAPRDGIADFVDSWFGPTGVEPDIILLMIGTNDVDTNYDLANAGARLDALVTKISDKTTGLRPSARLIVAQLVPVNDTAEDNLAKAYNAQVATVVAQHAAAGESVSLVDMHSALGAADLFDKLHPNDSGYGKMADVWCKAIVGP